MSHIRESLRVEPRSDRTAPRLLGVFANWRLLAYGYTFPVFYAAFFIYLYSRGLWLVNKQGIPVYHDFTNMFVAGSEALHGHAASVYDPVEHLQAQEQLIGTARALFSIWPYPPPFFLILAPLAALPYLVAFFTFEMGTLLGLIATVYRIVRRTPAIALVLASPFTAWNFLAGQGGFLTAALIGASLLVLERRPMLAGMIIGCLSYKPQFVVLFPVALVAGNQWRAAASAAATIIGLAGISIIAFGIQPWVMLPDDIARQAGLNLAGPSDSNWGLLQTVYGLLRYLNGAAALAWLAQGMTAFAVAVIVWTVWRSRVHYALKAATLSAAAFIVTPYTLAYDLAGIAVSIAFLATDQLRCGVLRGEQTTLLVLFAASLPILFTAGRIPLGAPIVVALLFLILRRTIGDGRQAAYAVEAGLA